MFRIQRKKPSIFKYRMNTILSKTAHPVFSPFENNNVMVYGGSGTGKSHCFVVPNLMLKNGSYVVADPGGDLYRQTSQYMKSDVGGAYDVRVLNLKDPENGMHYNPFRYIHTEGDIRYFVKCLHNSGSSTGKRERGKDPFWDTMGELFLQGIVFYIFENLGAQECTFDSVLQLISCFGKIDNGSADQDGVKNINFLIEEAQRTYGDTKSTEILQFVANNPDKTFQCITSSAASFISTLVTDEIKELTRIDELNLVHITDQPTILYIIYDETDQTRNAILNILYMQLFNILYHAAADAPSHRLSFPVRFLIDDFANTNIPNFPEYLATCRKYNISICPILQSPNQLIEKYGKETALTIEANCGMQLFTGSSDLNELHDISELFYIPLSRVLSMKKFEFLTLSNKKIDISKAVMPEDFLEGEKLKDIEIKNFKNKYEPIYHSLDYHILCSQNEEDGWDPDTLDKLQHKPLEEEEEGKDYKDVLLEKINSGETDFTAESRVPYDSHSEEKWYVKIKSFLPDNSFTIERHKRLTDLFSFGEENIPYVYTDYMHCDFVVYSGDKLLFGVEVDGVSHLEEHQKNLDAYKDLVFSKAGVPLIRVAPEDYVNQEVIDKIKKIIDEENFTKTFTEKKLKRALWQKYDEEEKNPLQKQDKEEENPFDFVVDEQEHEQKQNEDEERPFEFNIVSDE